MRTIILTGVIAALAGAGGGYTAHNWIAGAPKCDVSSNNLLAALEEFQSKQEKERNKQIDEVRRANPYRIR